VFQGFNLEIGAGERVAVLGPSEAGKSTLALCLQGLIPRMIKGRFRGQVEVAGSSILSLRPRQLASRVGTLFQDFEAQLFCTRVDQEVAFGPENLGLPREELRHRVRESLELVGLKGFDPRDPATLSGGQKQLLALAAVLALKPRLLILDEPTSDLDPLRVEELLATLGKLSRLQGLTLLLLGADLRLARHCSRLVLLSEGRIAADGEPAQVLKQTNLFRQLSLRPPALPALFRDLGQEALPLTLEEAVAQAQKLGWKQVQGFTPGPALPPPGEERQEESSGPGTDEPGGPGAQGQEARPATLAPATAPEVLALRRVTFAYPGETPLLQDFSLGFREGELAAILGPNGSGKTTVLKLLRGLLKPQAGEVWAAARGEPLKVGFVFQNPDYQLFAEQVWEEVALGPRLLGLSPREVKARVSNALARVHLLNRAGDDPFSLTKGQRQRLAVAGVLALAPQVIILDEPTTGLDHREQEDLLNLVRELHGQGHTIIMVTHSMWAAATYAQRLVVLQEGRLILDGPTREVLAREDVLTRARLTPPAVVQLSRRLGFLALTPQEFLNGIRGLKRTGAGTDS
jgi:energy-coupling factor transporter ATP-binding protein EcfA2